MAYKCIECGHVFEFGEEIAWMEPHGEEMTGCPICRSAFSVAQRCARCLSEHLEDELYHGGVCKSCLVDLITPKRTAGYVKARNLEQLFYIDFFFNSSIVSISDELLYLAKREFFSMAGFESIGANNGCTEKCKAFVVGDDEGDLDDFAKWVEEEEM